ncbi:MAG: (d)CMP kinase [Ruminococcaceae bacterium]|jgi:cytidylate kinase|nr:(d)CMP kinase [Oscillospiraceae bacterium]
MINIAIDGPGGAGKSTIAKAAAKELGYIYVDTGALYRSVGLYALRKEVKTDSADEVVPLLSEISVELKFIDGSQRVYLNGEDVSEEIRTPEASMAASNVSAIQAVRDFLFDLQRNIAKENNCIMDGRDIGTVVLPNAQVKIFLTASAEERAKRRYLQLMEKGQEVKYEDVLKELQERDYQDSHREIAPLKPAEDSIIIDTSDINLEQSIDTVVNVIRERV